MPLCMTIDTDWCSDEDLLKTIGVMRAHRVRSTVFFTHVPKNNDFMPANGLIEPAIHPNFMPDTTQGENIDDILDNLQAAFPTAVGVRNHRCFWYSNLATVMAKRGFLYDSSVFMPLQEGIRPYHHWGLWRLPIWFMDSGMDFFPLPTDFFVYASMPGLKIMTFHPQVIWNDENVEAIFTRVLKKMSQEPITYTLLDIVKASMKQIIEIRR